MIPRTPRHGERFSARALSPTRTSSSGRFVSRLASRCRRRLGRTTSHGGPPNTALLLPGLSLRKRRCSLRSPAAYHHAPQQNAFPLGRNPKLHAPVQFRLASRSICVRCSRLRPGCRWFSRSPLTGVVTDSTGQLLWGQKSALLRFKGVIVARLSRRHRHGSRARFSSHGFLRDLTIFRSG